MKRLEELERANEKLKRKIQIQEIEIKYRDRMIKLLKKQKEESSAFFHDSLQKLASSNCCYKAISKFQELQENAAKRRREEN